MGLKQGDLSSPIMFHIYINELCTYVKQNCNTVIFITNDIPDIFCLLFTNDVATCADTVVSLQKQLNTIDTFCTKTDRVDNLKKSDFF